MPLECFVYLHSGGDRSLWEAGGYSGTLSPKFLCLMVPGALFRSLLWMSQLLRQLLWLTVLRIYM